MDNVDVLVVGGGPSGLTVAAEVASTGATVLVLEKRSVAAIPRAGTVMPRPLELFDARGIADRFIQRTCELNPHPFQTWHIWAGMHPVDWTARDSRFGFTLFLAQHESEGILRDWAEGVGVELRFSAEVLQIEDQGDHVHVEWRDHDGQARSTRVRYVVGADGGQSRIRQQAGIEFTGRDSTFTGIIATAEMAFPWGGGLRVGHNQRGWLTAFPFGPELTRFTLVHTDGRQLPQEAPVTLDELTRYVAEILEEEVTIPGLVTASRYGDAQRIADRMRNGSIFLVGESARIHYPASGVGMNFCIQDAFNLGWKLGAVLTGHAPEELLDTYERERRPIAEDLFRSVDAQVAIQFNFSTEGLAFIRHFENNFISTRDVTAQLWNELNGLETPYPAPAGSHPSVGHPVPDFEVILRDGTSTRLYELLRTNPFVILDMSGVGALRELDLDARPATTFEAHPARMPDMLAEVTTLIVRPDAYVGWASTGGAQPADIAAELDRLLAGQR